MPIGWTNPMPIIEQMAAPDGGSLSVTVSASSITANIQSIAIVNTSGFEWRFELVLTDAQGEPISSTVRNYTVVAHADDTVTAQQLRTFFGRNVSYRELSWSMNGVG